MNHELNIDELNEVRRRHDQDWHRPVHSAHDRPDLPGSGSAALRTVHPHQADRLLPSLIG